MYGRQQTTETTSALNHGLIAMKMRRTPTYLRVVVTTVCPMRCDFCHAEGDPHLLHATQRSLPPALLSATLRVAHRAGVQKYKFLGGEPLLHRPLPQVVADLRAVAPTADLSVITAGIAAPGLVDALYEAGLNRMNASIHGFGAEAFMARGPLVLHHTREAFLARLIDDGRPIKLNYVYTGPSDRRDLAQFLEVAAGWPVTVSVLDDLSNQAMSDGTVAEVLRDLRGPPARIETVPDRHSLATSHWVWTDGLRVEIKDRHLGELSPWRACGDCPDRPRCREGIFALRLTHDGWLRPCMDRPDLGIHLSRTIAEDGEDAGLAAWRGFVETI